MTRRPTRGHRGRHRDGLFWQPGQDDGEPRDNPKDRPCPWPPCRATVGRPCTNVRGRPMNDYHPARKADT